MQTTAVMLIDTQTMHPHVYVLICAGGAAEQDVSAHAMAELAQGMALAPLADSCVPGVLALRANVLYLPPPLAEPRVTSQDT